MASTASGAYSLIICKPGPAKNVQKLHQTAEISM